MEKQFGKILAVLMVVGLVYAGVSYAAFTSSVRQNTYQGNKRVVYGIFNNTTGTQGGNIDTGLTVVDWCDVNQDATQASNIAVDERFPIVGANVTIVTNNASVSGNFKAEGW